MNVEIKPVIDHEQYEVNGHTIVCISDSTWIVPNPFISLSQAEKKAFGLYRDLVINNPRFKKHPKSTYKN